MTREAMESLAAVLGKKELRYHNYVQGKCCWGHSPTCLEDVVVFNPFCGWGSMPVCREECSVFMVNGDYWSGACKKHAQEAVRFWGWKIL